MSGSVATWKVSLGGTPESRILTVDFSRLPEITNGDTIIGTPVFAFQIPAGAPSNAQLPTVGTPSIDSTGKLVQARITFASNPPVGLLYPGSCTVGTAAGNELVASGYIDLEGST